MAINDSGLKEVTLGDYLRKKLDKQNEEKVTIGKYFSTHGQNTFFNHYFKLGNETFHVFIKTDSATARQASAEIYCWKNGWIKVVGLDPLTMKTDNQLPYLKEQIKSFDYMDDEAELIRLAKEIL